MFTGGKSIGHNASGLAWNSRIGTGFPEAISSVFSSVILAPQLSHQPSQPCNWPNQVCVLLLGYFFCFWRAGYVQCFLHTWKPLSRNPLTGIQTGRHTPQRWGMWTWGNPTSPLWLTVSLGTLHPPCLSLRSITSKTSAFYAHDNCRKFSAYGLVTQALLTTRWLLSLPMVLYLT